MFISPTEPQLIKQMGVVSSLPEEYGADIMWSSRLGTVGVQRKQYPGDFLVSIQDGRLNTQMKQMKGLDIAILLLEGRITWTTDGELYDANARGSSKRSYVWTRLQHRNFLASVQLRGIQVSFSESITDTIDCVNGLRLWSDKGEHIGLDTRPTPTGDLWGTVSNEDYVRYLYQSLPGIGPKAATAIQQRLGMIFRLVVGEEDLTEVEGIGKVRAKRIIEVFKDVK